MILIYRNVSKRDKRWVCGIIYESWVIYIKSTFRQLFFFLKVNNVSHKKRQKLKQKKTEEEFYFFLWENGESRSKLSSIRVWGVGLWLCICCKESKLLTAKINFPPPYSFIVGTLFVSPLGPISLAFCLSSCEII